ncbi:hypothetical protein GMSM_13540 [Geomonas sp. Red276]
MILLVDDDELVLEVCSASLAEAGYETITFNSPLAALPYLEQAEPELIVSDLMMPDMDGFGFREAFLERFPARHTPFLFLSSMSDPDIIIEGLERGADDFLLKPIDHRVFAAKVKSVLKKKSGSGQAFRGDLAQFPLPKVMRFCELKGITGGIEISGEGVNVTLRCRSGNFELEKQGRSTALEKVMGLSSGRFTILVDPVDYTELGRMEMPAGRNQAPASPEVPTGALSGVRVRDRLFQVQSEYVEPGQQIVTLVILDGKVRLKRGTPAALSLGRSVLQQLLEEQHVAVEKEIQEKLNEKIEEKNQAEPNAKQRFNKLLEDGLDHYRQGEHEKALAVWEEAALLNPGDKLIETNLKIVRKKLGLG